MVIIPLESIPELLKDLFEGVPADQLREHLARLGTRRTPEQHAYFLANQNAVEKQLQAQDVKP